MAAVLQLDKISVKRSFAKASDSYDALAELQRHIGSGMLRQLDNSKLSGTILELGCGTGFMSRELDRYSGDKLIIAMDIAMPMLQVARRKCEVQLFCADIETLPVKDNSIDWIFSNLALQWCPDLQGVFSHFRRVLKPGGRFLFSTFGPQTLQELKQSWAKVDNYSHVNNFYSIPQLRRFLLQAGLQNIQIENWQNKSEYKDVMELMKQMKGIGAHNVTRGRNRGVTTKAHLHKLISVYEELRVNGCLPATFDVIYVAGKLD